MAVAKPQRGDQNWDVSLNAKLDDLDLTVPGSANALAASGTYVSGAEGPGYWLPKGCLDRWYAAKVATASTLVEVPFFGDSTTYGQESDGAGGTIFHSWLQDLRTLALAAGLTDGGRGLVDYDDLASLNPDGNFSSRVSKTANWHAGFDFGALGVESYQVGSGTSTSGAAAEVLVLQGKGTAVRIMYTTRNQAGVGAFTVSVDGGAAVNLTCAGTTTSIVSYLISGLSEGTHTVTITTQDAGTVTVAAAFLRASGLVLHKVSKSGTKMSDWWSSASNRNVGASFGLTGSGEMFQSPQGAAPTYPHPPLAVLFLGGNDQSAATTDALAQTAALQLAAGIGQFAEVCRTAGTDGLVLMPTFHLFANHGAYMGLMRQAIAATARAHRLGLVDMSVALGGFAAAEAAGYTYLNGVHLTAAGYSRWASWLWTNVLNRASAP